MADKKKFTYDEHLAFGEEIQRLYNFMTSFSVAYGNTYSVNDRAYESAYNILQELISLKHEMDEIVFRENGKKSTSELGSVYYAVSRVREK